MMFRSRQLRSLLPFGVLALAALLGGCVAYPAYPSYGYSGGGYYGGYYGAPYYSGGVVAFGGGWRDHDRDWRWRDHDRDWRR
jgi:hypothetical protein